MNLPRDFQFSQANLQDYVDCRRRFLLRHILRHPWPAIETEPVQEHERYLQQGAAFHRLAQQFLLGIPPVRLAAMIHDPVLAHWWEHFLQVASDLKESEFSSGWKLYPETGLSAPLVSARIIAKYDLLAVSPQGNLLIYDWKTSRNQPRRQWLEKRLQTRVYPYLLARAGSHLIADSPLQAEQIEMVYWFTEHPGESQRFPYSSTAFQADEAYLSSLIETILRLDETEFYLTSDERRCTFCTYRSLCNRGVSAGSQYDLDADLSLESEGAVEIDFEQIAEIEF